MNDTRTLGLQAAPDRLIRPKFFDPERLVRYLGWRPTLLALEAERARRHGRTLR